jgi:hypothetical protein
MSTVNVPNTLLTTSSQWEYKPCKILTRTNSCLLPHPEVFGGDFVVFPRPLTYDLRLILAIVRDTCFMTTPLRQEAVKCDSNRLPRF